MALQDPTNRSILNDHKVDALTTRNNDLRQRKIVNSAPGVAPSDVVVVSQLTSTQNTLNTQINAINKSTVKLNSLLVGLVRFGPHATRLVLGTGRTPNGAVYFETDRNNVEYQFQTNKWIYVGGTMVGTQSPDQRPTDLGVNDTGFLFQTTDTLTLYRWSGTAWVALSSKLFIAQNAGLAGGARVLGTVYQNLLTTPRMVSVALSCHNGPPDANVVAYCDATAAPSTFVGQAYFQATAGAMTTTLSFMVIPTYHYQVAVLGGTVTLSFWTEWQ